MKNNLYAVTSTLALEPSLIVASENHHLTPNETNQTNTNETDLSENNLRFNNNNNNNINNSINNNSMRIENEVEDIDSTDDLYDDDHSDNINPHDSQHTGHSELNNLTGIANNAAMFIEDDKRKRRAIANSNERRRMQSINAGFQTLKSLIPHSSGEKLSKACILQRSADFMQFLSNEKDKLSNKLQVALKLLESSGLVNQYQSNLIESTKATAQNNPASHNSKATNFSAASKSTTKINKQYATSTSNTNKLSTASATVSGTASSLLTTALTDCTNEQIHVPSSLSFSKLNACLTEANDAVTLTTTPSKANASLENPGFLHTSNSSPSKLLTPIAFAAKHGLSTNTTPSAHQHLTEINNSEMLKAKLTNSVLPNESSVSLIIQLDANADPLLLDSKSKNEQDLMNPANSSLLLANLNETVNAKEPESNEQSIDKLLLLIDDSKSNNSLIPRTGDKPGDHDLINILNNLKEKNPNLEINSTASLIFKSILTLNQAKDEPDAADAGATLKQSQSNTVASNQENIEIKSIRFEQINQPNDSISICSDNQLQIDTYNIDTSAHDAQHALSNKPEKSILMISQTDTQENQQASVTSLSNQHLKNVSLANKSSRSNSIDQLIAAAAVTANSSTCMSPLSPLHSPLASQLTTPTLTSKTSTIDVLSKQLPKESANQENLSRKNLNTIVEAIFHVEGAKRLDELTSTSQIGQLPHSADSLPSSSYVASSSGVSSTSSSQPALASNQSVKKEQEQYQQQQKPPKKRKYTTEDVSITNEDYIQHQTPYKQATQFISDYYNKSHGVAVESDHCKSINKLLIKSANQHHQSVNESGLRNFYYQAQQISPATIIIINNSVHPNENNSKLDSV